MLPLQQELCSFSLVLRKLRHFQVLNQPRHLEAGAEIYGAHDSMRVLCSSLEDKTLVWFEKSNKFVQMEEPAYQVFSQLEKKIPTLEIAEWCSETNFGLILSSK